MGATPFLQDLTYSPAVDQRDLSSLRLFISAGAAIPRKLVQDARKRLRCAISAGGGVRGERPGSCKRPHDTRQESFWALRRPPPRPGLAAGGGGTQVQPARR